jgi:hypothetical protein
MRARDLMAPDTDPTDEELLMVAKEALSIALERRSSYDEWVTEALVEATIESDKHRISRHSEETGDT